MPPLIVTAAVIETAGKILITRRPDGTRHAGLWEFPGGKLDDGESPQQCLQRELREELDLHVEVGELLDVLYHPYDWGAVLLLVYRCHSPAGTIRNLEVAEHRWVARSQLMSYPFLEADISLVATLTNDGHSLNHK